MVSQHEAAAAFATLSPGLLCPWENHALAPARCLVSLVTKALPELLPIPCQGNGFWCLDGLPGAELGQGATSALASEAPLLWDGLVWRALSLEFLRVCGLQERPKWP